MHASHSSRQGTPARQPSAAAPADSGGVTIATITGGVARGAIVPGGYSFSVLPYGAPPAGNLRWRPPPAGRLAGRPRRHPLRAERPAAAEPCPDRSTSEDCLYLNVYTPTLRSGDEGGLPVLVWIHGGRFTLGSGRDYDGTKLAADGIVVVTINFRLGVLGFLAHPALASPPGGPSGNYGFRGPPVLGEQGGLLRCQAHHDPVCHQRLPRRGLRGPAQLGRTRLSAQPHPLRHPRQRRPLRRLGTSQLFSEEMRAAFKTLR